MSASATAEQPTLWEYVARAPENDVCAALVALMQQMARRRGLFGVTIGEVVYEYEKQTGLQVGGLPMDDKMKQQRQTSWLARVPKMAGLVPTKDRRPSPVRRHHHHAHVVYQWPEVHP